MIGSIFALLLTVGASDLIAVPHIGKTNEVQWLRVTGYLKIEDATRYALEVQRIKASGQGIIPIIINSRGGAIYTLERIQKELDVTKLPILTYCIECQSAAAMLLMEGDEGLRYAHPDAKIMIHGIHVQIQGNSGELQKMSDELFGDDMRLWGRASEHIGQAPWYFPQMIVAHDYRDIDLTADEALKHNIVNYVRIPSLRVVPYLVIR